MIKGIVEPGYTMLVIGETGIGKTSYSVKAATSLLRGKRLPGLPFKNEGQFKRVLLLTSLFEVSFKKIIKLLNILGISKETRERWRKNGKLQVDDLGALWDLKPEHNYDAIIIDGLSRLLQNENEAREVSQLFYWTIDPNLMNCKKPPFILMTHASKDERPMGHKIIANWPRTTLLIRGREQDKKVQIVRIKCTDRDKFEDKYQYSVPDFKKLDIKQKYRLTAKDVQNELLDIGGFVTIGKLKALLVKKYKVKDSTADINIDHAVDTGMIVKNPKKGLRAA